MARQYVHRKAEENPIDPSAAPPQDASANSDPLPALLGWLANRIAAITGKQNWWTAPRTTLEAAGQHLEATAGNPHGTTAADVGALVSVNQVSNPGGDVDFVPQGAINLSSNDAANTVTFGVDAADTTQPGVAEVATDAETEAGADPGRIVPPSALRKLLEKNPFKLSVRAATTANVALSGTQTIDDVALAAGDRVLVKNQTNGAENGIWVVQSGAWARASDADAGPKLPPRTFVVVQQGTSYAGTVWTLSTSVAVTIGTTALAFQQLSGGGGGGGAVDASGSQKGVARLDRNPQVSTDPVALGQNSPILETHVEGLRLEWTSANQLTVRNGDAWIPGLGRVLNVPADISKTFGTAAGQIPLSTTNAWYYVYLFDNAGTPDVEVATTAPVAYKGTARHKTGDNTRRFIGTIRVAGTAHQMLRFERLNKSFTRWVLGQETSLRVYAAGGASPVSTDTSLAALQPPTSRAVELALMLYTSGTSGAVMLHAAGTEDGLQTAGALPAAGQLSMEGAPTARRNNLTGTLVTGGAQAVRHGRSISDTSNDHFISVLGYYEER